MREPVVRVDHLRKVYGDFTAVDGASFEVYQGEIFGLLGPNGAGKTSALETLEGLRACDGGVLEIMGVNPRKNPGKLQELIGVQLQTSGLPGNLRVDEIMKLFCCYRRVRPRMDLLERLGLTEKRASRYCALSTGEQQRLTLALALIHNPPVIILDEPTAGLDVQSRLAVHTLIQESQTQGSTVILATHDMAEAEKLAGRVAIMARGKIIALGSPRELTASGGGFTKISARTKNHSLKDSPVLPAVLRSFYQEEYMIFFSRDIQATITAILAEISRAGDTLLDLRAERPSLEERFLEITNRAFHQQIMD